MAGNKKSKGNLADEPDSFISFSDKLGTLILKFKYPIIAVLIAGLLGGLVNVTLKSQAESAEKKAQSDYYVLQKELREKQEKLTTEEVVEEKSKATKKSSGKEKKESVAAAPKTKTIDEPIEKGLDVNYGDLPRRYTEFINKHADSKAAFVASIELAQLYVTYDKPEAAKNLLAGVSKTVDDTSLFFGLIKTQLGTILSSLGKYNEAISEFNSIIDSKHQASFHSDALLRVGLAYEGVSNLKKARQVYRRLSDEFDKTSAGRSAKNYLRLLSFKEGQAPSKK